MKTGRTLFSGARLGVATMIQSNSHNILYNILSSFFPNPASDDSILKIFLGVGCQRKRDCGW
jgi:hypothetical protein